MTKNFEEIPRSPLDAKPKGWMSRWGIAGSQAQWMKYKKADDPDLPPVLLGRLPQDKKTITPEDKARKEALAQAFRTGEAVVKDPTGEVPVIDVNKYTVPVVVEESLQEIDVKHE